MTADPEKSHIPPYGISKKKSFPKQAHDLGSLLSNTNENFVGKTKFSKSKPINWKMKQLVDPIFFCLYTHVSYGGTSNEVSLL